MLRSGGRGPDAARSGSKDQDAVRHRDPQSELAGLYRTLDEYLQLEDKTRPRLTLPTQPENGEVSTGARDGAAHVMRCLKMWFDLPPEVFLHAVNLLDRFLTKMKVRPCHIPCVSVSCVNIGIQERGLSVPVDELVCISQCGCTTGDVARMTAVVREKLSLAGGGGPVTALDWLRLLGGMLRWAAGELGLDAAPVYTEHELISQLEMVMCDATCANLRAGELALVLLYNQIEESCRHSERQRPLQECCAQLAVALGARDLSGVRRTALVALRRCGERSEHRQRLVWRLSSRTMKLLRPTDRFLSRLPTIEEQNQAAELAPRPRSESESSDDLSESKDWPRSPVLPVCE